MTIRNQAFLESIHCVSGEVTDARFRSSPAPVAIAESLLGGKPKKAKVAKHDWEECQALAKILNVSLGHNQIQFASGSFENGKHYGYRNASTAYQALLTLQSDRLAAKSNEAIAAEAVEAHAMIEDTATPAIIEDEWSKDTATPAIIEDEWSEQWREKFAVFTDEDWAEHHGAQVGIVSDRLAAKSNEAIAVESVEAHAMIEDTSAPEVDEWTKAWNERFANYTDEDWAREMGSSNGMVSDRADVQSERTINFPVHTYDLMRY